MVGYILVYLQNITSIDAESGLSCDTTGAETSSLWRRSHSGIPNAIRPFGTRAVYRCSVFAPSVLFWCGLQISAAPLSALDATLMFARPPSALSMRMYSTFALNRATGLIRTTNANKEQAPANRTIFSPPFRHKKAYITIIGEIDAIKISFAGNEEKHIKLSAPSPVGRGGCVYRWGYMRLGAVENHAAGTIPRNLRELRGYSHKNPVILSNSP